LANDGFAQQYVSPQTAQLPAWAQWQDQLFSFTQEPAALVISDAHFAGLEIPKNREQLIDLLRAHPEIFDQRIGTYDVRTSGLGYLFATQDSRNTDSFWRLTEVMGRLNTRLYCCSGAMIDDVYQGRLALAYNVLGSYAENRLAHEPGITIVPMQDYVTVMMRTAFIPRNAQNPDVARRMIDFLLSKPTQESLAETTGLPPVFEGASDKQKALRPIRLGPGLLVFLDRLKRQAFLRNWENSIRQD
jgi:iron(III) transport system substrate-binding protein